MLSLKCIKTIPNPVIIYIINPSNEWRSKTRILILQLRTQAFMAVTKHSKSNIK